MLNRCVVKIAAFVVALWSIADPALVTARNAGPPLPSPVGPIIPMIKAMVPGSWLDLGSPRADPKWGRARGRAWTSKMAYSKALGGAFLFGEGVHGWFNNANGRYMDGLWFYDVNAHRWVNMHPGTDTRSPPVLRVTNDGFEGISENRPVPIATMVHGYEMTAWDPVRQLFFSMPNGHSYFAKALPGVATFRAENQTRFNRSAASPWMFDPWNRKWHRLKTPMSSPKSGYGSVLMYIPSKQKLLFYLPKRLSFYDPDKNTWQQVIPGGPPPPFGIDPTACHDPKRDRMYIGGGAYPTAKGPNALWIYDIGADRWVDPAPHGGPGGNQFGTNVAVMSCDSRKDRIYLFRYRGNARGVYLYDARNNAWGARPVPLPDFWVKGPTASGFFHPGLGVQFIFVADDSLDNGRMIVYRPPN
jgi:hypothetical protein